MRDFVKEHEEFVEKFGTEEQCRDYLYALRWSYGFCCPKCGYNEARKQNEIKYRCKGCRKETSLYECTIFENTRKPLTQWFSAIWYITLDPDRTNASELKRIVKLGSNNTALEWWKILRPVMFNSEQFELNGRITVEEFLQNVYAQYSPSASLGDSDTI